MRLRNLVQSALQLKKETPNPAIPETVLLGESPAIEILKQQIRRVARSQAPIFISGESGSGKELVARAIHFLGARANGPFIPGELRRHSF